MKRYVLAVILFVLVGASVYLALQQRREGHVKVRPIAPGETVTQMLPGPKGKLEAWKITGQEIPREKLPDLVLPKPAPRTTPEDERTESARALDAQGMEAWKRGNIEAALSKFEAAVKADPDDPEPHSDYGRLLTLMTDYKEAQAQLERAAQLKPEDPQVWLDLANVYERSILLERAADARKKAEELAPGQKFVRDANGLLVMEGKTFP